MRDLGAIDDADKLHFALGSATFASPHTAQHQ